MMEATINVVTVHTELRSLGVTLEIRPDEYRVNFRNGKDDTAYCTDELHDALGAGRAMAAAASSTSNQVPGVKTPRALGKSHRPLRRMTPKAQRKRMIRQHNRRMRARFLHPSE